MIQTQIALLQRELWEHRAIFVVPVVVAVITLLTSWTGQVTIGELKHLDAGIVGAANMPENARSAALSFTMVGLSVSFIIAMWILTIFYALDSLYAERKDRSILFWRSIPVTDFETVLSKLLTALLIIPLVTFVVIAATQLLVLLSLTLQIDFRGGSPWQLIWSVAPFADTWAATVVLLLTLPLWLSPFLGWFLFVSAYTKRSPLLVAALPIVLLPMFEKLFFDSAVIADALFVRSMKFPLFAGVDNMELMFQEGDDLAKLAEAEISVFSLLDLGSFLASPQLWLGIVVCGLFTAAAIYVRRYRDDS
jgi:ABC-2 type transport system permease protein